MSKLDKALSTTNTILEIAARVGGPVAIAIPLVTGLIKWIKKTKSASGEVEYIIAIKVGQENLAAAEANFGAAVDSVKAELARMGAPPLETIDED